MCASAERVLKAVPGLATLWHYDRSHWPNDALAALVVTLVLIPSAIAYADLAKCAPGAGLYAAVAGMLAFALFTSSRHLIIGPDAAIALLVGATIGPLAANDPGKAVTLATMLAFLTAGVLFLMARLQLGVAADFLSSPALLGFMNGAAVVIVGSQIGKLCGVPLEESNTLLRFWEWATRLGSTHIPTVVVGSVGIAVLAFCRWRSTRVPGAVVVFALALLAGIYIDFSKYGLQLIGAVDLRLPNPVRPSLTITDAAPLFTAALGISLLVFSEGVILGRTVAEKHGYNIDADQELVAFSAANVAAGMLCSFAVGSSQTRTLLNDATGGRTQLVSFLAAALTMVFSFALMPWIATIPSVAIAAILVVSGATLIDLNVYHRLWHLHSFSTMVAGATSVGVIALGVLPGILLGVLLSLLGVLAQVIRPHDALLGRVEGSSTMHDVGDDEAAKTIPGLVVYRFYGPLIFANVRFLIERIEWFISQEETPVRQVILDARAIPSIDITAAEQLHNYVTRLRTRDIEFIVAKAHLPLRETASAFSNIIDGSWKFANWQTRSLRSNEITHRDK